MAPVQEKWGGEGVYAWFRMCYTVPEELDGRELFLWPRTGFYEATLWVNGSIHSNYAAKFVEGSHGNHWCNRFVSAAKAGETYALLPHEGGFGAQTVIQPAYAFNYQPITLEKGAAVPSLVRVHNTDVIIETVKPCENVEKAYILRLYEATGGCSRTKLTFSHPVKALHECNMLEGEQAVLNPGEPLTFAPFKIRTIKVCY